MTTTAALANLVALTGDQLAAVYGATSAEAQRAASNRALGRAFARRERVLAEVNRRGCVVRRAFDGTYMVGHWSTFEPR